MVATHHSLALNLPLIFGKQYHEKAGDILAAGFDCTL